MKTTGGAFWRRLPAADFARRGNRWGEATTTFDGIAPDFGIVARLMAGCLFETGQLDCRMGAATIGNCGGN